MIVIILVICAVILYAMLEDPVRKVFERRTVQKFLGWWNTPIDRHERIVFGGWMRHYTERQGWLWIKIIVWAGVIIGCFIYFIFIEGR